MAVLLLLARGDVGELRPEGLLQLRHLLDALHRGRDPGLEHGFGAHGVEARAQAVLDLAHHALLHRPEIGQAEEGARLLGRAGHFDVYFHASSLRLRQLTGYRLPQPCYEGIWPFPGWRQTRAQHASKRMAPSSAPSSIPPACRMAPPCWAPAADRRRSRPSLPSPSASPWPRLGSRPSAS